VPLSLGSQDSLTFLRVVWLEYVRDTTFYERVLDIKDAEVAQKTLPKRTKVTELSFNERHGYLCHASSLEEIIISEGESAGA